MISLINNNANNLNQMLCHFLENMILASVDSKLPVQWQAMHTPTKECMKPSPCTQTKSLPFRPIGCMTQRPVQIHNRWADNAGRVSSRLPIPNCYTNNPLLTSSMLPKKKNKSPTRKQGTESSFSSI